MILWKFTLSTLCSIEKSIGLLNSRFLYGKYLSRYLLAFLCWKKWGSHVFLALMVSEETEVWNWKIALLRKRGNLAVNSQAAYKQTCPFTVLFYKHWLLIVNIDFNETLRERYKTILYDIFFFFWVKNWFSQIGLLNSFML